MQPLNWSEDRLKQQDSNLKAESKQPDQQQSHKM